jgi:hypothetical protein
MPQPVREYDHLVPSPHAFAEHPNPIYVRQFSNIVAEWTTAEIEMSYLALDLLGLHGEAALPLYETLQSGKTQRDAIEALVRANLDASRVSDYAEITRRLSSARKQRNTVVHGVWAISNNFPADMILLDQRELLTHRAVVNGYFESKDPERLFELGTKFKNLVRYSVKDFGDIIRRLRGARHSLFLFQTDNPLPPKEP